MEWQHPEWLYLILPMGVAWLLLSLYSRRRRLRAAEAFVAQAMWSRILPPDSLLRFWVKMLLREAALVMGLVALAGPRFGTQFEEVVPRGSDLYVLIDVSRSMLAGDVPPSRLGRAKADVAALVNRLQGERVGLIAFAGQAVVKCPLTVDYDAFRRSLDELDPSSAPRGGTAIGDAIRKALEVFHARAERDQAILLITDGDDQQSYPLEAAAVAAERHVTIFTVGLGDADHGARIPQGARSESYVEYQGQQVWSKLNGSLLKDIALKTSGVYVPVGTRAYDLGELYASYLQGRRGSEEQNHRRIRRADQFQVFLALALLALLADAFVRPFAALAQAPEQTLEAGATARKRPASGALRPGLPVLLAPLLGASISGTTRADSPDDAVRAGLRLYEQQEFDKAREQFAAAREQFSGKDGAKSAIAAFDQACAAHSKGDLAAAREWYLNAGLAHDKNLAAAAHFNLGTLAAQEANRLAGDHPENVAPDKRQEILGQLKSAVAAFRHSLELQPDNGHARRDIELVRQWIKYYSDQWHAHDREARRQETNLVAFLEFLIETERALRESVKALPSTAPADAFAELKRLQDELLEEVSPLKEKIRNELQPQQSGGSAAQGSSQELEKGIALLQEWAGAAGDHMRSAARQLSDRQAEAAARDQKSAIAQLEKIWEAVIPFHPLLARDLAEQTTIARSLNPASSPDTKPEGDEPSRKKDARRDESRPAPPGPSAGDGHVSLGTETEDLARLKEFQERTLRRTQLLKLKAESELARLDKPQPPGAEQKGHDSSSRKHDPKDAPKAQPRPVDPEQIKTGYQRAIKLTPQAFEQMQRAVKALRQKQRQAAHVPAEDARKTLEEIQKAQPKNDQQDRKQKDQEKKNEEQRKQDQKGEQKDEQQKQDKQKDDVEKKDQQKKDQESKKQEEPKKSDEQKQAQKEDQKRPQPQVSPDRIEELLRNVRERQQEKRDRDRKMKASNLGRMPVEKDW
jgi:Ca-activated chloride channel family protein